MQRNDNQCGKNFVMCNDFRMIMNGYRCTVVNEGINDDTEVVEVVVVEFYILVNIFLGVKMFIVMEVYVVVEMFI